MQAVILAGGKGTRLRPYTTTLPKPLVPVGEQPILSIILRQLREAGVNRVVLAVNHLAELIMAFFGTGERFGLKIEYSIEDKPLSTIAPLKLVQDLADNFLVMNGDVLTDLDYSSLFRNHLQNNSQLTIATYERSVHNDFGVLNLDSTNRVVGFREKPTYHFQVSMGVYALNRSVLDCVPSAQAFGFDDLVLRLLRDGKPINAYRHRGYWLDLGRPDDYDRATQEYPGVSSVSAGAA
jgi:NDP-mannose synthase